MTNSNSDSPPAEHCGSSQTLLSKWIQYKRTGTQWIFKLPPQHLALKNPLNRFSVRPAKESSKPVRLKTAASFHCRSGFIFCGQFSSAAGPESLWIHFSPLVDEIVLSWELTRLLKWVIELGSGLQNQTERAWTTLTLLSKLAEPTVPNGSSELA